MKLADTYCPVGLIWHYSIVSEECFHIDLGKYHTYGIEVAGADYTKTIHDISTCKETALQMAERFNRLHLSDIHFEEAVEAMLF